MSQAADLHRKAMALVDRAMLESIRGAAGDALALYREALELESAAAADAVLHGLGEPTISVLHRSAATLALDAQNVREAERLVVTALSLQPPDEIADELRDLLEQVYFRRHLVLRGVHLGGAEFQFAMSGPAVGFGIVESDAFVKRVETLETMLYRTAERQLGRAYRDSGQRKRQLSDDVAVYVSVPRAASFAVTLKVGTMTQLPLLPGEKALADRVVDEVLTCIDLLNRRQDEAVRQRIKDPAYLANFIALAKKVAPDGEEVTGLGFTAGAGSEAPREVAFRRQKKDMPAPVRDPRPIAPPALVAALPPGPFTLTGRLGFADELQDHNLIGIQPDDGGPPVRVHVPPGLMADIVKPLWGERVKVQAQRIKNDVVLTDIDLADNP